MTDSWLGDIWSGLGDVAGWAGRNANWLAPVALAGGSALFGQQTNQNAAATQQQGLANATAAQQQSNADSLNFLRYAYDTSRADQAPYRQAGQQALSVLTPQVATGFQASPGYQFAFGEGQRAVDSSAAGRGMLNSGATAKALTRYGQGMANQEYGNYLARLQALSGTGQTAANQGASAAQQYGQNAASVTGNTGNALASLYAQQGKVGAEGQVAGAQSLAGGANSLLKYFSDYKW